MKEKDEVILRCAKMKYKKHPKTFIPAWNGTTYVTGQHIDPRDPKTSGNLTLKQMLGQEPLSKEQMEKFPYVINPKNYMKFPTGTKFDRNDVEERAKYEFLLLQSNVAASNKVFRSKLHDYYFEDVEHDSKTLITDEEMMFLAKKYIFDSSVDRLIDTCLMLNYTLKSFFLDTAKTSLNIVKAELIKLCNTNPQAIMNCYAHGVEDDLFILKCVKHGIVTKKESNFYDGVSFIGSSVEQVKTWLYKQENAMAKDRWTKLLSSKLNSDVSDFELKKKETKVDTTSDVVSSIEKAIEEKDLVKAERLMKTLVSMVDEWKPEFNSLEVKINKLKTEVGPAETITDRKAKRREELAPYSFDELVDYCIKSKRRKLDWEQLQTREELVDYLVSLVK